MALASERNTSRRIVSPARAITAFTRGAFYDFYSFCWASNDLGGLSQQLGYQTYLHA